MYTVSLNTKDKGLLILFEACQWLDNNNIEYKVDNIFPNVYYTFIFENEMISNTFALKFL